MLYTDRFQVDSFPWRDGARDVVRAVQEAQKMDWLQELVEERFAGRTPTQGEVNDFVWFEKDFVFERCRIRREGPSVSRA